MKGLNDRHIRSLIEFYGLPRNRWCINTVHDIEDWFIDGTALEMGLPPNLMRVSNGCEEQVLLVPPHAAKNSVIGKGRSPSGGHL